MIAVIVLSGIWGYNWVVMKACLDYAPPFVFAALRTSIGAASLFLVMFVQGKSLRPREFAPTLALGLLSTTGCIGLVTLALYLGAVGKTAILVYIMPFWVLVLAWPLLGERLVGGQWMAVTMAWAGLMIILEPWNLHSGMLGNLLAVASGMAWAGSAVLAKIMWKRRPLELISLSAWQMLLGSLPLIVMAMAIPGPPVRWTPYFIAGLSFSSVISQALALMLWFYLLKTLPAGMASMATLATPVIGMIAAAIELGERPSLLEGIGMVLVLAGLAILALQGVIRARELKAVIAVKE
ncbi:MAG: DMT family transporter [Pseudomonadota bacterium]|nr:DMT family transporter [Pseudomonadota bacterium]